MVYSMTAFARAQKQIGSQILCWELRSVNNRYLDISFRMPENFRGLELELRNGLRNSVNRGKLECNLRFSESALESYSFSLNEKLVHALVGASARIAEIGSVANDVTVSDLLSWPGVLQGSHLDQDALNFEVGNLFQEALQQLVQVRKQEGSAIKLFLEERLDLLSQEVQKAEKQIKTIESAVREKLLGRLESLQLKVERGRMEEEIAILLTRLDVAEELSRLQTHIQETAKCLESKEAMGRKLDFLMQELNREANTLSSKSDSVLLTQKAVQMKVCIDQMREQIQNIE